MSNRLLISEAVNLGKEFKITPDKGIGDPGSGFENIGEVISRVLPNIYTVAGIILLFLLIGGGFMFIVGAGNDSPDQAKKGKQAISAALAGFAIIFASYWIIQLIQYLTGIRIVGKWG